MFVGQNRHKLLSSTPLTDLCVMQNKECVQCAVRAEHLKIIQDNNVSMEAVSWQAVSCRPLTAEARFRSQGSSCEIRGEKVILRHVLLQVLLVSPVITSPPMLHVHFHLYVLNRRKNGRCLGTF